jgi:hypothetical protein
VGDSVKERWVRGADREHRDRDRFDPVVEGAKHALARELSLAIWERVRADATDAAGRCDTEQAAQRFHELAARIAARGGRLVPEVGKLTRTGVEPHSAVLDAWRSHELSPRAPGRETLVSAETRRWMQRDAVATVAHEELDAGAARLTAHHELPGASEVVQAMAALHAPSRPAPATLLDASVGVRMSRLFDVDLTGIGVVPDSPAATGSTMAVTKDGEVHFRAGAYRPGTPDGDRLIAHELAHVVQQRGAANSGPLTVSQPGDALEREADSVADQVA